MLLFLSKVTEVWQFYAVWFGLGIAMSGSLYEACFAIITHSLGGNAKRAITIVTLIAGFAGTISFPSSHFLIENFGWRCNYCIWLCCRINLHSISYLQYSTCKTTV